MKSTDKGSGLRLARIAGDSVLREKVIAGGKLNKALVEVIAVQMKSIIGEMVAEWENDRSSDELREGFHLLDHYVDCLKVYGASRKKRA